MFPDPAVGLAAARELDAKSQEMGIAVRIAARVMAAAGGDQIVVSRTVRDLMLGSGYRFRDLGARELKGVEGTWELYEVLG